MRTTPEIGLASRGAERPVKGDGNGVMIGQDLAVRLVEFTGFIVKIGGGQGDDGIAAEENLVDRFARVGCGGVVADGFFCGWDVVLLEEEPGVC